MPDFSWLDEQRPLSHLLDASGVAACWRASLSRHTAGIEVEATRFTVLAPLARPVPLAVLNPLAVLGSFTAEPAGTAGDSDSVAATDSVRTAPSAPTRPRPTPRPESRSPSPAGTPSVTAPQQDRSRPPVPVPPAAARRSLPHPARQRATAAQLQALAGTLPDAFRATAPAGAKQRPRPDQMTPSAPAAKATTGPPSNLVPPPPDGLSLLAQLTQAPAGKAPDATTTATAGAQPAPAPANAGAVRPVGTRKAAPAAPVPGRTPATPPETPTATAGSNLSAPFLLRALRSPITPLAAPALADSAILSANAPPPVPASQLATLLRTAMAGPNATPGRDATVSPATGDADPTAAPANASPVGERYPVPSRARPTPVVSPPARPGREVGLALLQRALSGVRSSPPAPVAVSSTRPEASSAPAAEDTTPAAPSPPAPAVQNTFNVKVHMDGHPAGEEELAARLNRILVEQARRFGIDV